MRDAPELLHTRVSFMQKGKTKKGFVAGYIYYGMPFKLFYIIVDDDGKEYERSYTQVFPCT